MKGLYDNEMKLEFLSKSSNEAFARITVAAFVSQLDPTIEEISDIKTAVSEAVTNCIIHAYEDTDGIVKIVTRLIGNTVEIEISDTGKGIENVVDHHKGDMYVVIKVIIPTKLTKEEKKLFENLKDTMKEDKGILAKIRKFLNN